MDTFDVRKNAKLEQPWKTWLREEIHARQAADENPEKQSEQERLRKAHELKDKVHFDHIDNAAG